MTITKPVTTLDLHGKTITTFILYEAYRALQNVDLEDRIEILTDAFASTSVTSIARLTGGQMRKETIRRELRLASSPIC